MLECKDQVGRRAEEQRMAHPNDTGGNRRKLIFGLGALASWAVVSAGRALVSYAIETLVVEPALEWAGDQMGIGGLGGCSGLVMPGRRMAERADNSTSGAKSQRNAQAPQQEAARCGAQARSYFRH